MVTAIARSDFAVSPDALVRLVSLVVEAGAAILEHYRADIEVREKGDRSPVTAADHAAHRVIVPALEAWTPDIPVVSEEGEIPHAESRRDWTRFWLVDPLDGTKEFIARNGEFTVNVALVEGGVPVLGAIYAPALDLLYYAGRGIGSWKREGDGPSVRIVSHPPRPGRPLRVVESRSHPSTALEAWLKTIPVAERVSAGSSLKFCWVAEGKADVYPRLGPTMEWDVAAGDCIFRNSGVKGERRSPLVYNKLDLRNGDFVLGLDDASDAGPETAGAVLWFTGLSGSGKSTIAKLVVDLLAARGRAVEYLDGDEIREVFPATGFTPPERDAHVRRVGWVASRLERHGVVTVAALISPYETSRAFVRGLCRRFVEIYVSTPFDECARRDVKGLYAKAKAGEIRNFTGLDDPYEPPVTPEIVIDTRDLTPSTAAARVIAWLDANAPARAE